MIIALSIYLLSIACWLGGIVFFSFFTAPAIFTQLPIPEAGKVVGVIFPRYYLLGYIAGIIAFALAAYFTAVKDSKLWWASTAVALAIALALTVYAGAIVRPRVDAIRIVAEEQNPDPDRKAEFDRLHHLSVFLNGAVLLLNLAAIVGTAGALTPRG
ncbi:MAG TPA: DUF4149 domain-containing protein [Candidatus Binataceae bacterium]|nr:DUF4149 domain-containing protein [Candidatus Binataceae bacterium]